MHYARKRHLSPGRAGGLVVLLVSLLLAGGCDEGDPDTEKPVPAAEDRPSGPGVPQVDLPQVEPRPSGTASENVPPVALYLLPSGDVVLEGTTWPLATGRPEDQAKSLVALRDELRKRTAHPELREPDRSSKVPVIIHGDRNARWQYVQWIMQVCAEPTVGIYKIRFAARPAGSVRAGSIEMQLPKDRGLEVPSQVPEEAPVITVKLFRKGTEDALLENDFTRIRVGHEYTFDLPKGAWTGDFEQDETRMKAYEQALQKVTSAIRDYWAKMDNAPEVTGEIKTPRPFGLRVPHGDVIRVLDCFLKAGITDVRFEGAPAPLPVARSDR